MFVDHYLVLGLPTGEEGMRLTDKHITKAFKAKALEVHPDKRHHDEAAAAHSEFQNLTESYQILIDVKKRQEFDALLLTRLRSQQQQQQKKIRVTKRPNMTPNFEGERKKRQTVRVEEKMKKYNEIMNEISKIFAELEKELEEEDAESKARKTAKTKPSAETARASYSDHATQGMQKCFDQKFFDSVRLKSSKEFQAFSFGTKRSQDFTFGC